MQQENLAEVLLLYCLVQLRYAQPQEELQNIAFIGSKLIVLFHETVTFSSSVALGKLYFIVYQLIKIYKPMYRL